MGSSRGAPEEGRARASGADAGRRAKVFANARVGARTTTHATFVRRLEARAMDVCTI